MTTIPSHELFDRIKRLNPWLVDPKKASTIVRKYLPAQYVSRYVEQKPLSKDRAILVIGPRQSGKTTMAWHLLYQYLPNLLYVNMEDLLLRSSFATAVDLAHLIETELPATKALFIDEIQHLDEAALFVKGLVDARLNMVILITGSSSFHLASRTRESLAGRAVRNRLLPFGFSELVDYYNPANSMAERDVFQTIFGHQIVFGSYPAVYFAASTDEKMEILSDLSSALILRDASDLFRIKRVDAFRRLLALLAGQVGSLLNLSELASICNVDVGTISNYIEILEESHIVKRVRPYAAGKRREITGTPKVYFIDNGIRNQLIQNFRSELALRTDKGPLAENWVFSEIVKALPFQSNVGFWRSKGGAEVDFVVEHGGKLYGIEVKASPLKRARLSRSARSFVEAYRPEKFVVVNMSLEHSVRFEECDVVFMTPYAFPKWLLRTVSSHPLQQTPPYLAPFFR